MIVKAVRHHRTSRTIRNGLPWSGGAFTNHVFNEVWVGHKWVRLNYDRLGQGIVDPNYEGLMTHVYTANDVSEIPFSTTWGSRFGLNEGPKLSSVNPYQLLSASDHLRPGASFENPPVPALTSVTIVGVLKKGDPAIPAWVKISPETTALIVTREWLKDDYYHQLRDFRHDADLHFLLVASGHQGVPAHVTNEMFSSGDGTFQAFGISPDKPLERGVDYRLVPRNLNRPHRWLVATGVVWRG